LPPANPTVEPTTTPPLPAATDHSTTTGLHPSTLATAIAASSDKLFFISYVPDGTTRPRWYLVQVDLDLTAADPDCADCSTSGIYQVQFLLQHPNDNSMSQPRSRWWPQWNRYTIHPTDGIMDFGTIHLCPPGTIPDPSKFVAWSTAVPLTDPTYHLLGPFDFSTRLLASDRPNIVAAPLWDRLFSLCQARGIIPPALSPITRSRWLSRSADHTHKKTRLNLPET
jgi:hypothetical protein